MPYTPPGLTRFYSKPAFGLDVLENLQVALVRVTLLNDPFDPYAFFETEFDGYLGLFKHVVKEHPRDLGWFKVSVTSGNWRKTEDSLKDYMADLRRHCFVLCTSAPTGESYSKNNTYMWGHYGAGHRSLAIEFDPEKLEAAVVAHNAIVGGEMLEETDRAWIKIEYADSFAPISAEDVFQFLKQENELSLHPRHRHKETALSRYYRRLSLIKGRDWEIESEWRLLWRNRNESADVYNIPITSDCIKAVYLGCQLAEAEQKRVVAVTIKNFPDAEIWQASKRHGDLSIQFRAIKDHVTA
jgi:hypothetical protein